MIQSGLMQLLAIIPNFCIDFPSRFSIYRDAYFFLLSIFCMDLPFGFSAHRDAHFLPNPPFWVFNLASCSFIFVR